MQSLALERTRPMTLLAHFPLFWAAMGGIAITAMWLGGLVIGIVAVVGACACIVAAVRRPMIRGWLERAAQRAAWRIRCDARESRLEEAGVPAHGLEEATRLVREVQAGDPVLARHLALEGLLDHYVEVALRTRHCERTLDNTQRFCTGGSTLRRDLEERQTEARRELQTRIREYRDELEAIPELLCVLVQRSVLEATTLVEDPIGERLAVYADVTESGPALAA